MSSTPLFVEDRGQAVTLIIVYTGVVLVLLIVVGALSLWRRH